MTDEHLNIFISDFCCYLKENQLTDLKDRLHEYLYNYLLKQYQINLSNEQITTIGKMISLTRLNGFNSDLQFTNEDLMIAIKEIVFMSTKIY